MIHVLVWAVAVVATLTVFATLAVGAYKALKAQADDDESRRLL